jgi:hypothetical protein
MTQNLPARTRGVQTRLTEQSDAGEVMFISD